MSWRFWEKPDVAKARAELEGIEAAIAMKRLEGASAGIAAYHEAMDRAAADAAKQQLEAVVLDRPVAGEHECPLCHGRDMLFAELVVRPAEGKPDQRVTVGARYQCARCGAPLNVTKAGVSVPTWWQMPKTGAETLEALRRDPNRVIDALAGDMERPLHPGV